MHCAGMAFNTDGVRCIQHLFDAGASVNVSDANGEGQTPLWYAAYASSADIVCTLVENNADMGIMHEISFSSIIRGNVLRGNCHDLS